MVDDLTFIETQFPVSKLSKESYKERKANHGQTLTGLGKWWGRKPLVLVRAAILGLLIPASDDPAADRDVFLRLLTMDDDGLWRRKNKNLTARDAYQLLTPKERVDWFTVSANGTVSFRRGLRAEDKEHIQKRAFLRLNYDEKQEYCLRPEHVDGPSPESWVVINGHLGTGARSLPELVRQLGERRFGHTPRVGDAFSGGGSIPFEAARIGCDALGSDLSPVAALLTWSSLNIIGGGHEAACEVRQALQAVYSAVKEQIDVWGIERDSRGWVADAFLYCHEVWNKGWLVPLAPSWVIGERTHTIARLCPDTATRRFRIEIHQGVTLEELEQARQEKTWEDGVKCPIDEDGQPIPPNLRIPTSVETLRGSSGLRRWENDDLVPGEADVFQERLYCIRWRLPILKGLLREEQRAAHRSAPVQRPLDAIRDEINGLLRFLSLAEAAELASLRDRDWCKENDEFDTLAAEYERVRTARKGSVSPPIVAQARDAFRQARDAVRDRNLAVDRLSSQVPETIYSAPTSDDQEREEFVLRLLRQRFSGWLDAGYIPSMPIEPGDETGRLARERGYTYWHHLFNPRQLLTLGLFARISDDMQLKDSGAVGCLLGTGRMADWNSRLSMWMSSAGNEGGSHVFYNQGLNTIANYSARPISKIASAWFFDINTESIYSRTEVRATDARSELPECDLWITDPAYADAVNYEELGEFFLAWYAERISRLFPEWYTDSKRALAVRGSDEAFRLAMVECYGNFARRMPDNGLQVVMFTHTNAEVWADLALILWAAGLRVTAAWTIATETDASGLKQGNYVQGTVLLVLRKQTERKWADLADIFPEVQTEVERQLAFMNALDDADDPNFSDSDFQLAAYAAALRVLTRYGEIAEINVDREIRRVRRRDEKSPLTDVIEKAVRIASDYLVPHGIDKSVWRTLTPEERLYVKGVEVEAHGDYRNGVYMEFARGYGVRDYRGLLGSTNANQTRLKTPSEFRSVSLSGDGFAGSLLRQVLFAVYKTSAAGDPSAGREWLHREVPGYWDRRTAIVALLSYLAHTPTSTMRHWDRDKGAAELLAGLLANDTP